MPRRCVRGASPAPSIASAPAPRAAPPPESAPGASAPVELVGAREAARRQPAGLSPLADPILEIVLGKGSRPVTRPTAQAFGHRERLDVGEPALVVFLEDDTAAAAHLGHLFQGKHQELAVLPEDGNPVTHHRRAGGSLDITFDVEHLLARPRLSKHLVRLDDESTAVAGGKQKPLLGAEDAHMDDVLIVTKLHHQAQRLAKAAASRQLVAAERVEAAVGREDEELVRGLAWSVNLPRSPSLYLRSEVSARCPFTARIQPF